MTNISTVPSDVHNKYSPYCIMKLNKVLVNSYFLFLFQFAISSSDKTDNGYFKGNSTVLCSLE